MESRNVPRTALRYSFVFFVVGLIAALLLVRDARVVVARFIFPGVCTTEEWKTLADLSGIKFEVLHTTCDDSVDVYVSKAIGVKPTLFSRWSNERTLVFSYIPGRSEIPSIQVNGRKIQISIPDVSWISTQRRAWREMQIDYAIGQVQYP